MVDGGLYRSQALTFGVILTCIQSIGLLIHHQISGPELICGFYPCGLRKITRVSLAPPFSLTALLRISTAHSRCLMAPASGVPAYYKRLVYRIQALSYMAWMILARSSAALVICAGELLRKICTYTSMASAKSSFPAASMPHAPLV